MIPLPSAPKSIKKDKNKSVFKIEGLYPGYGVTVGNTLRRVLLSSIEGAAITEVKIKGVSHEFSTISGVLEDTIMIIQNLKNLRFKIFEGEGHTVQLKVKGEKEAKGSDLDLPPQVELANPSSHIATLTSKNAKLEMEIKIRKGIGYESTDRRIKKKQEIGTIPVDAIYTPVRRVNFQVENMRVGERTDFDRLNLEVETDGTLTPEEVFGRACQILIKHFSLFVETPGAAESERKVTKKEKKEESDLTKIKIESLDLSARTANALLDNGIKTIGGLLRKNKETLLEIEGLGKKGLKEIKKELKKLNLELD